MGGTRKEGGETATVGTRERILDAAIEVFARKGYHGTSVDDIVQEAGSSKGSFYFYFPNKEGLFLALVEEFAANLASKIYDALAATSGGRERVRAAVRNGIAAFAERPALAKIFLIEAVGLNPSFEMKRREIYGAFAKLIRGYLDDAVAEGDLPEQDTELAAYAWLGVISEGIVYALESGRKLDDPALLDGIAQLVLRAVGYTV